MSDIQRVRFGMSGPGFSGPVFTVQKIGNKKVKVGLEDPAMASDQTRLVFEYLSMRFGKCDYPQNVPGPDGKPVAVGSKLNNLYESTLATNSDGLEINAIAPHMTADKIAWQVQDSIGELFKVRDLKKHVVEFAAATPLAR